MWMSFVLIMSGITATFYYASIGGLGDMPDLKVLENPKTNLASEVFSSDNKTLGKYFMSFHSKKCLFYIYFCFFSPWEKII